MEKARKAALSLLKRRPRSRKELNERLRARMFAPEVVERVLAELDRQGLINERAYAESIIYELTRKQPASQAFLRARLEARGIRAEVIEAALAATASDESELEAYIESLQNSLAVLEPQAAARRLAGRLSRRGYDAETIRGVIEARYPGLGDGDL